MNKDWNTEIIDKNLKFEQLMQIDQILLIQII